MDDTQSTAPQTVALDAFHREHGARMVPFAGYAMPVQYDGIIAEHNHTRTAASLFDVSHMGQAIIRGDNLAAVFEKLVPADLQDLQENQQRYTMLTNDQGGILDDFMIARVGHNFHIVVNASRKNSDFPYIAETLGNAYKLDVLNEHALLALQGPTAAEVLDRLSPNIKTMPFMSVQNIEIKGIPCFVSRSGYTGEDGFEISLEASAAEQLAQILLNEPEIKLAGLGARDSLRLEAGLCLYGNEIDETTTPIEAGLTWTVGKRRRAEGGFPGDSIIQSQIKTGVSRKRVGLQPEGRAPVRAHVDIIDQSEAIIGEVTSGGFGPSINAPIAMGYVSTDFAKPDTPVQFSQRNKIITGKVIKLPFVNHRYFKS